MEETYLLLLEERTFFFRRLRGEKVGEVARREKVGERENKRESLGERKEEIIGIIRYHKVSSKVYNIRYHKII